MSDDDCSGVFCGLVLICAILTFIFMTFASPGFLLYGFFSTDWLIEDAPSQPGATDSYNISYIKSHVDSDVYYDADYDRNMYRTTTPKPDNKIHHGLFWVCYRGHCEQEILDDTTFGLEVTAVTFQFLAILALPWLKSCIQQNKCLKYWNYCFLPFLMMAAVMSLSASIHFLYKYSSISSSREVGPSQKCAGLGGGFQIVLVAVIGYITVKRRLKPAEDTGSGNNAVSIQGATRVVKTEYYIMQFFSYDSYSEIQTVSSTVTSSNMIRY